MRPGTQLGDRYTLKERLGSSAEAEVWLGHDSVNDRAVRVKVLSSQLSHDCAARERFETSARAVAGLATPGIVNVLECLEHHDGDDLVICQIAEHVEGKPLNEILSEKTTLSVDDTLFLLADIAWSLHEAHTENVHHLNLKPANVIVEPEGSTTIVDFGFMPATPLVYTAPEYLRGEGTGVTTDVYALGAIAYECLTGQPFALGADGKPPQMPDDATPAVALLLEKAVTPDVARRFKSAALLAADAVQINLTNDVLGALLDRGGATTEQLKTVQPKPVETSSETEKPATADKPARMDASAKPVEPASGKPDADGKPDALPPPSTTPTPEPTPANGTPIPTAVKPAGHLPSRPKPQAAAPTVAQQPPAGAQKPAADDKPSALPPPSTTPTPEPTPANGTPIPTQPVPQRQKPAAQPPRPTSHKPVAAPAASTRPPAASSPAAPSKPPDRAPIRTATTAPAVAGPTPKRRRRLALVATASIAVLAAAAFFAATALIPPSGGVGAEADGGDSGNGGVNDSASADPTDPAGESASETANGAESGSKSATSTPSKSGGSSSSSSSKPDDKTTTPSKTDEPEDPKIKVPDVVGDAPGDADSKLSDKGLKPDHKTSGEGEYKCKVTDQNPNDGASVPKGTSVEIHYRLANKAEQCEDGDEGGDGGGDQSSSPQARLIAARI